MAGSDDEIPPPPQTPTQQAPHTVSTIKLPILKKGEYDIWAMKMEHYLSHTDYPIWEVIQKGNVPDAIKSRFGGNDESKKMQKYILKQQFEGFSVSNSEGLHKGYDRFHILLSQLEIYGAGVSTEDANQKFLRSLPSSWSQVSLVMRIKPGVDSLSFDDLYNNLRVFESDVKGSIGSSSSTQNVAFVFSESTSSTNDVSTAYDVSTPSGYNLQRENSSSYTDELMYSFFANQSSGLHLDHEDLEQLDESKGNQKSNRRDAGNTGYKAKDNERRHGKQEEPKALVTLDGEGVDWTGHAEDEQENFALMAYSNSGSDTEVTSCSKECVETYAKLKKLYDEQREQLGDASIEIQAYTQALKKMSKRDKSGLGYGDQVHNGVLSYENEVFQSVFDSRSSDVEDSHVHDIFANIEGMHAVPPPMTRNYMPSGPDREVDDSMFTYGLKQSKTSESDTQTSNYDSCESNSSTETLEFVPEPVVVEPKVVSQPKVWPDAPIIEEYESDSDDEYVNQPSKEQERPSFAFIPRETVKEQNTYIPSLKLTQRGLEWHMTGNKAYLAEYQDYNGGHVAFGSSKGYITCKGKIKTGYMCDKKNKVLFTDTECLVLSSDFKLPDENQVLLRIPRQNNMYSFNLENIVPSGGLACLIAKATVDESNKWHRRLGHVNFKNLNKLVKGNLVRGLPSKIFQNDHTCVACQKGKQHKASCKAKIVSSISQPLQLLHMDLFGPTSVRSINHKTYCLVITDDFSRFSWVFFLRTKDETSGILKDFIRQIENQLNQKVKTIRCDNGTEFKNRDIIEFCGSKGIKREYSNARTPQQNGVAERKNRTLIEAARTMLADSFLPNTFWAEAVSTACYVLNRVLVTKPQNKTPYELITGKIPIISYIRPFGCHVTILNTIDHLGKFEGKSDEGFLVGYSLNSKAFRVYNLETKRVEENLHINFLENKPNVAGKGPNWLFDLDYLTDSMNYQPVRSENQANKTAGPKEANHSVVKSLEAKNEGKKPNRDTGLKTNKEPVDKEDQAFLKELERLKRQEKEANDATEALRKEFAQDTKDLLLQAGAARATSTNTVNTASTPVSTDSPSNAFSTCRPDLTNIDQDDFQIPTLKDIYNNLNDGIFTNASYDDEGAVADFTNLEFTMNVSPIPTSMIHSIHSTTQILGDLKSAVQTRSKVHKCSGSHAFKKAIGTKWVYRNKKDERGVVVRNKARIEAIRIFLAFASYMGFIVYHMDVKSAFLYGKIDEEMYVSQPPGFVDPKFPKKVYKVVKALRGTIDKTLFIKKDKNNIMLVQVYVDDIIFGSTKRSLCDEFEALMKSRFQMSSMGELTFFFGLQEDSIFISRDKYVAEILKKFDFASVKTASTPIKTQKSLTKDEEVDDVHVTPKTSHLNAMKRIFRYFKGKPKLGLWYPRVSSFDLEAYSNSDYAGANLDRKSTTGEAEYVDVANCCVQVLWIQNQMLDYGFNFMNINIYIDNESTICIIKNPVFHSITKHIKIRHHFIRDAYKKKLIQVLKIHTDDNVADLLTKAFDVSRHQELASPEQTASGKDFSNPLIVDSLLKTIWFINAPCFCNEALAIPGQTATGKELSNPLMAGFCYKHNMVDFIQNPSRSEEFHQIVDFLAGSHIMYALTTNPTIYVSLVEQFWQTATVETLNDGEQQITVTFDGYKFAITEASIRRHLQLADVDVDGISSLPNTEIFEQLSLMRKGVHIPLFDTMLLHDHPGQGEGPTLSVESQHTHTASSPSTLQPSTSQPTSSPA
ncbi:putative ribonuclease H-like domain-containing protein [Tanacetum coccineum]